MSQEATNDVRERLQEIARTISVMLPPYTGFALLAFDLGKSGRMEYVANGTREDIIKAMEEFIKINRDPNRFGKHI